MTYQVDSFYSDGKYSYDFSDHLPDEKEYLSTYQLISGFMSFENDDIDLVGLKDILTTLVISCKRLENEIEKLKNDKQ